MAKEEGDMENAENDEGEADGEKKKEAPKAPLERKGSIRLRSVRRESLDNSEHEKLEAKRALEEHGDDDDDDDDPNEDDVTSTRNTRLAIVENWFEELKQVKPTNTAN